MARYKDYSYEQGKLIAVTFNEQIQPGTFEYALHHIINELDLSEFENRFINDETGAPAYDPIVLLKIVLFAYSRGIIGSRRIAQVCCESVIFMALSADTRPHFTTIADFISTMQKEIVGVFRNVLLICSKEGLIGKNMFAVDGCKISSNCSKEWSGTHSDFERKKKKLERSIEFLVGKHRQEDTREDECVVGIRDKEKKSLSRLRAQVRKINTWLAYNDDRRGASGNIIKSNITDNESAKMPSSHGVIQGYSGVAMVDDKHQVIVDAEAFGSGDERRLLKPMIDGTRENFEQIEDGEDVFEHTRLTADSGFHSEKNMGMIHEEEIDAYIADPNHRQRDPHFADAKRHRKSVDKRHERYKSKKRYFAPSDFKLDEQKGKLICPAGNELYVKNSNFRTAKGLYGTVYIGWKTKCRQCELRAQCIRGKRVETRQVLLVEGRNRTKESYTDWMKKRFDSMLGKYVYSRRMGTVEPVFANICKNLGLDKFTFRGTQMVDTQWKLYCIVHNIGKLCRNVPRFAV